MKTIQITFNDLKLAVRDAPKLRGAVASRFSEQSLFHNHSADNRCIYRYPRIQYKVIDCIPMVIGIDDGVSVLNSFYNELGCSSISPAGEILPSEIGIKIDDQAFGLSDTPVQYRFMTPWMALNQRNHERFVTANEEGRKSIIRSVLTGNILSFSKSSP